MKINATGTNLNRRNWLKVAAGLGTLGFMSPERTDIVGKLLAQEEPQVADKYSVIDTPPKLAKDSAADLFNLKNEDPKLILRTGGRDIAYEILRLTPKKSFANKTWCVKGENGWDYVQDLREFAMYVAEANDPKQAANHFAVKNLRKQDSPKVSLDDIVHFGMNIKSAWLASLTVGALAAGWSAHHLPSALNLINTSLAILNYDQSTQPMRRNIERVIANKLFGETATSILSEAFKYKFDIGKDTARYKAGEGFKELEILAPGYEAGEKFRLDELRKIHNDN